MATDRLVARIETERGEATPFHPVPADGAAILTPFPNPGDATLSLGDRTPHVVLIEIPESIVEILSRSPAEAHTWRLSVRDAFTWALAKGYTVSGVQRGEGGRTYYVAARS